MELPNAVRVIFVLLTAGSFIPQYRRIAQRRDCAGLSGWYLFYNNIVATQHLAVALTWILFMEIDSEPVDHHFQTTGDWLNLAQFIAVCGGHFILLVSYLVLSSATTRHKVTLGSLYLLYLIISFVPIILIVTFISNEGDVLHNREIPVAILMMFNAWILTPLSTVLAIHAYFPQARELRSRSDIGAVSEVGLILQAVVFLVSGVMWNFRWGLFQGLIGWDWYMFAGWAVLDDIIFAVVQHSLWKVAKGIGREVVVADAGETEPLIGDSEGTESTA